MEQYKYTETVESNDPLIQAALAVATRAHAGQSRRKIDPSIMYITHPVMAYDLMKRMGETDPAILAATLLHDAVEDCPRYKDNHDRLAEDLYAELLQHGVTKDMNEMKAMHHAFDILMACEQMSKPPEVSSSDKETFQVDRVAQMDYAAKKIKIADQTASLIDNLTMANDPLTFNDAKAMAFTDKAHSLVGSILRSVYEATTQSGDEIEAEQLTAQVEGMKRWESLFARSSLLVEELFRQPEEKRDAFRQRIDYNRLTHLAYIDAPENRMKILTPNQVVFHHVDLPKKDEQLGISRVNFDDYGRVPSFVLHVDNTSETREQANLLEKNLKIELRKIHEARSSDTTKEVKVRQYADTGERVNYPAADGVRYAGRIYYVYPPMLAKDFAEAYYNACSKRMRPMAVIDCERIRQAGEYAIVKGVEYRESGKSVSINEDARGEMLRRVAARVNDTPGRT